MLCGQHKQFCKPAHHCEMCNTDAKFRTSRFAVYILGLPSVKWALRAPSQVPREHWPVPTTQVLLAGAKDCRAGFFRKIHQTSLASGVLACVQRTVPGFQDFSSPSLPGCPSQGAEVKARIVHRCIARGTCGQCVHFSKRGYLS